MFRFRNLIGHSRISANQILSLCFDSLTTHGLRLEPSTLYLDPINCHHLRPFGCRHLHVSLRLTRNRKMTDQSRNVWILKGKQMGVAVTHVPYTIFIIIISSNHLPPCKVSSLNSIHSRQSAILSCRHTFSPVICSRQLRFCREDFPLNYVTVYLDPSFDSAIDFPMYLMKFVDQNAQFQGKLLVL